MAWHTCQPALGVLPMGALPMTAVWAWVVPQAAASKPMQSALAEARGYLSRCGGAPGRMQCNTGRVMVWAAPGVVGSVKN